MPEIENIKDAILTAIQMEKDGYSFYKVISNFANDFLYPGGMLFYEMGLGQVETVKDIMTKNNFINLSIYKDYSGHRRVISGELK